MAHSKTGFLFNNYGVVVGFGPFRAPVLASEELRISHPRSLLEGRRVIHEHSPRTCKVPVY
jgi:hypothetical protein